MFDLPVRDYLIVAKNHVAEFRGTEFDAIKYARNHHAAVLYYGFVVVDTGFDDDDDDNDNDNDNGNTGDIYLV